MIDDDGDLDLLASDRKGGNRGVLWLENPGAAASGSGRRWEEIRVGGADREVMFLAVGSLAKPNDVDIVAAVKGRGLAWFHRQTGKAPSWSLTEIAMPPGCGSGKGVAIGDVDLDGQVDLVFTCEHAEPPRSGVRWLSHSDASSGDGTKFDPKFGRDHEISGPRGIKFDRVELIDLDHDGDLDVLTCEERHNLGVFWYENPAR